MRLIFRTACAAALALFAASCSETPAVTSATAAPVQTLAGLAIAPTFSPAAAEAYHALTSAGGDITNVRIILHDLSGGVALDTVIAFPVTAEGLTLDLPVHITGRQEDFDATIQLRDASGTVLFSSNQRVTARDRSAGSTAPAVLTLNYVGPGFAAKTVTVSPTGAEMITGSTQTVFATALDALGKPVPDLTVSWQVSDAGIASVTSTGTSSAVVTSKGPRGAFTVTASVQSGIVGTAAFNVLPTPSRLVVVSGGGQTAPAYSTLANPFVVELQGTDGRPIANKVVSFRATGTNGEVGFPLVTTDANGRASTTMKLGRTVGSYGYEATSGTLAPATVTETATIRIPGVPTQLIPLSAPPLSYKVGVSSSLTFTAQIADANGIYVPQAGIVITATLSVAPSGATSSVSAVSDANGVVTFGTLPAFVSAGTLTIRLTSSSPTMTNLPFGTFTITP
ncbi:MAG: hypothetical protein JWM95_177 [Gemmatimonadetes bacterium]|nr:hypothetical protein [Gemmatimonadota bacterium]